MSKLDDGGPAFPQRFAVLHQPSETMAHSGMTLRDYFAGRALQGMLVNPEAHAPAFNDAALTLCCYRIADAMVAERAKTST